MNWKDESIHFKVWECWIPDLRSNPNNPDEYGNTSIHEAVNEGIQFIVQHNKGIDKLPTF